MANTCIQRIMDATQLDEVTATKIYGELFDTGLSGNDLLNHTRRSTQSLRNQSTSLHNNTLSNASSIKAINDFNDNVTRRMATDRVDRTTAIVDEIYEIEYKAKGYLAEFTAPIVQFIRDNPVVSRLLTKDMSLSNEMLLYRMGEANNLDDASKQFADLVEDIEERIRTNMNNTGSNIPYNTLASPTTDYNKVAKDVDKWRTDLDGMLDWESMIDNYDQLSDIERTTLKDELLNELEAGIASNGDEPFIQFKDTDAVIRYNTTYGVNAMQDLFSRINRSSRELSIQATLGIEPNKTLSAIRKTTDVDRAKLIDEAWFKISGRANIGVNNAIAKGGKLLRGYTNITSLGSAVLSSIIDPVVQSSVLQNRYGLSFVQSYGKVLSNMFSRVPEAHRKELAGLVDVFNDGVLGGVVDRITGNNDSVGFMAGVNNTFFKLTGLQGWTDNLRKGTVNIISYTIGENADKSFDQLDEGFKHVLRQYQLDGQWDEIRTTMTSIDGSGRKYINPSNSTSNSKLTSDLYRMFAKEVDTFVINPSQRERTSTVAGTVSGEVMRYLSQFKSFPIAYWNKIFIPMFWKGYPGQSRVSKVASGTFMVAQMTAMGYISSEAKKVFNGEKPTFLTGEYSASTLLDAFKNSGALGFYGDLVGSELRGYGNGSLDTFTPPAISKIVKGSRAVLDVATPSKVSTNSISDIKAIIPYNNFWMTKAVLDYTLVNQLKEAVKPGYLRRIERTLKGQGREYFVKPSKVDPFNIN